MADPGISNNDDPREEGKEALQSGLQTQTHGVFAPELVSAVPLPLYDCFHDLFVPQMLHFRRPERNALRFVHLPAIC